MNHGGDGSNKRGRNANWAAEYLGVSSRQVRRLAESLELTSYRLGNRLVFYEEDLQSYLNKCRQPTLDGQVDAA